MTTETPQMCSKRKKRVTLTTYDGCKQIRFEIFMHKKGKWWKICFQKTQRGVKETAETFIKSQKCHKNTQKKTTTETKQCKADNIRNIYKHTHTSKTTLQRGAPLLPLKTIKTTGCHGIEIKQMICRGRDILFYWRDGDSLFNVIPYLREQLSSQHWG